MIRACLTVVTCALPLAACGSPAGGNITSDEVLARVAAGNPDAIDAAAAALSKTDAGDHMMLRSALARAMQVAPERVLGLVGTGKGLDAGAICVPFLSEDESPQVLKETVAKSRKAIESVTDPALADARTACLAEVASAEAVLDRGGE